MLWVYSSQALNSSLVSSFSFHFLSPTGDTSFIIRINYTTQGIKHVHIIFNVCWKVMAYWSPMQQRMLHESLGLEWCQFEYKYIMWYWYVIYMVCLLCQSIYDKYCGLRWHMIYDTRSCLSLCHCGLVSLFTYRCMPLVSRLMWSNFSKLNWIDSIIVHDHASYHFIIYNLCFVFCIA